MAQISQDVKQLCAQESLSTEPGSYMVSKLLDAEMAIRGHEHNGTYRVERVTEKGNNVIRAVQHLAFFSSLRATN